jgi:hypothetical protein
MGAIAEKVFDTLPRHLKRLSECHLSDSRVFAYDNVTLAFFEGLVGSDSDISAVCPNKKFWMSSKSSHSCRYSKSKKNTKAHSTQVKVKLILRLRGNVVHFRSPSHLPHLPSPRRILLLRPPVCQLVLERGWAPSSPTALMLCKTSPVPSHKFSCLSWSMTMCQRPPNPQPDPLV